MLYCQVCCEPFHQFCLEPAERPTEENKENWCCRRCKFCHVCGRKNKLSKVLGENPDLVCFGAIEYVKLRFHFVFLPLPPLSHYWSVSAARTVITLPVWDQTTRSSLRRGKPGYDYKTSQRCLLCWCFVLLPRCLFLCRFVWHASDAKAVASHQGRLGTQTGTMTKASVQIAPNSLTRVRADFSFDKSFVFCFYPLITIIIDVMAICFFVCF